MHVMLSGIFLINWELPRKESSTNPKNIIKQFPYIKFNNWSTRPRQKVINIFTLSIRPSKQIHTTALKQNTLYITKTNQNHLATLHGASWITKFARLVLLYFQQDVINDPLGQTHSHAGSEHCFLLFCCGSTDGRTTCAKTMIPSGRDFGLAEWINFSMRNFQHPMNVNTVF